MQEVVEHCSIIILGPCSLLIIFFNLMFIIWVNHMGDIISNLLGSWSPIFSLKPSYSIFIARGPGHSVSRDYSVFLLALSTCCSFLPIKPDSQPPLKWCCAGCHLHWVRQAVPVRADPDCKRILADFQIGFLGDDVEVARTLPGVSPPLLPCLCWQQEPGSVVHSQLVSQDLVHQS